VSADAKVDIGFVSDLAGFDFSAVDDKEGDWFHLSSEMDFVFSSEGFVEEGASGSVVDHGRSVDC
jgi:hypothetical protein